MYSVFSAVTTLTLKADYSAMGWGKGDSSESDNRNPADWI